MRQIVSIYGVNDEVSFFSVVYFKIMYFYIAKNINKKKLRHTNNVLSKA